MMLPVGDSDPLSCGFISGHTNGFSANAAGDFDLLTRELASLFLAHAIELVNNLAIAVGQHKLAILCAPRSARFIKSLFISLLH